MKRQIHASADMKRSRYAGHDVKNSARRHSRIEFFVQTQQLIFGGSGRVCGDAHADMADELGKKAG